MHKNIDTHMHWNIQLEYLTKIFILNNIPKSTMVRAPKTKKGAAPSHRQKPHLSDPSLYSVL